MKKLSLISLILVMSIAPLFAATDDTQIIDELEKLTPPPATLQFELKKFESCKNVEDVMSEIMKEYYKNAPERYYWIGGWIMVDDMVKSSTDGMESEESATSDAVAPVSNQTTPDFSETNTQVLWVDESDIIKTDGQYMYYIADYYDYDTSKNVKNIFIAKVFPGDQMEVIKRIRLPENFYASDLYVADNKLTIIATGYSNYDYSYYWINRSTKTYVMTYDVSDKENLKLEKLYVVDGNYSKSRRIGEYLYVISQNYVNFPYYAYSQGGVVPEFDIGKSMPKNIDIYATDDIADQNLVRKGEKLPYNVSAGAVANCSDIEYILPDAQTMKQYSFSPTYNIVSVINLKTPSEKVQTKVIFGNTSEIYMSLNNLYLTSHIYTPIAYSCPFNARCIMPWYNAWENTLIHKLAVSGNTLAYKTTNMVSGSPLSQYSMDEKDGNFRILTTKWSPETQTDLFILDKDLKKVSSLEWLGKGETFQSSRYIGDKLFLVTFERIDPLFVIDLADATNPKILWELKIPGYSSYLHPYDDTHIMGLGFDTITNQWGGTQNGWLKVDLYEINYNKKCGDAWLTSDEVAKCASGDYKGIIVKQLHTKTFGEAGSYSEALYNPRMFVWNKTKKLLLLPATLYKNDAVDIYKRVDFFQGLVNIGIDTVSGIVEKSRITHIDTTGLEEKRIEECKIYTAPKEEELCRELLDGTVYCKPASSYYYVPDYCYKDASVMIYLEANLYKFSKFFVKRALYIGDNIYSISDAKVQANTSTNFSKIWELELK